MLSVKLESYSASNMAISAIAKAAGLKGASTPQSFTSNPNLPRTGGAPIPVQPRTAKPVLPPHDDTPMGQAMAQIKGTKNPIMKTLNALTIPAAATEQYLATPLFKGMYSYATGKKIDPSVKSYDKFLDVAGIKNTPGKLDLNDVISNAGRLIADPLNFIPIGKIAKIAGKVPGIGLATRGLEHIGQAAKEIPFVEGAINQVGKKFVRGYELAKENKWVDDVVKNVAYRQAELAKPVAEQMKGLFGKMTSKDKTFLGDALVELEKGQEAWANFVTKVGKDKVEKIIPQLRSTIEIHQNQLKELLANGRIDKDLYDKLINKPYYPHSGFERSKVNEFLHSTGLGEKRSYLRERKGAEGFTRNAPEAISRRAIQQTEDNAVMEALRNIKDKVGKAYTDKSQIPEGFTNMADALREKGIDISTSRWREFKNTALPKDVASYLVGHLEGQRGTLGKVLEAANKPFKTVATSLNVPFHVTNVMGNVFNSVMGGLNNPKRIAQAVIGGFSKEEKALIEAGNITSGGLFGAEAVAETFKDKSMIRKALEFLPENTRKLGQKLEDNARGAFYLDQLKKMTQKGLSQEEAIMAARKQVNKYLFDYRQGLTTFERNTLKPIFPFYSWARNNIPLQINNIINKSGKVAAYMKLQQAINPEGQPKGTQPGLNIPIPMKDKSGRNLVWNPNLPINDLMTFSPKKVYDMLSPYLKDTPEIASFVANKLSGAPDYIPQDKYFNQPRTKANLPTQEQARDLAKSYARSYLRPFNAGVRFNEEGGGWENFLRYFGIGGISPVDQVGAEDRETNQIRLRKNAINSKIRSIQLGPGTQESKDKAVKRLRSYQ